MLRRKPCRRRTVACDDEHVKAQAARWARARGLDVSKRDDWQVEISLVTTGALPKPLEKILRWLEPVESRLGFAFRRDRPLIQSNVKGGAKATLAWLVET